MGRSLTCPSFFVFVSYFCIRCNAMPQISSLSAFPTGEGGPPVAVDEDYFKKKRVPRRTLRCGF